jgi:hypothetical protein
LGRPIEAGQDTVWSEEDTEECAVETTISLAEGIPVLAEEPREQAIDWLLMAGLLVVAGARSRWERRPTGCTMTVE